VLHPSGTQIYVLIRYGSLKTFIPSYSNVYGIDMPSRHELVAYNRDNDSIAHAIGADLVIFQTLPDLISSVRRFNPTITTFDCSVFTGEYVTGGVDEAYLMHLEQLRGDHVRERLGEISQGLGVTKDTVEEKAKVTRGRAFVNGGDDTVGLYNSWRGESRAAMM
jgi:amidophosphoribosyltransferase